MCLRPVLGAAVLLVVQALGSGAQAQAAPVGSRPDAVADAETDRRARIHFDAGNSYYAAADYAEALREFERALALSKRPELHYNVSLCHQGLGNWDQAVAALERFLEASPSVADRAQYEERLKNLRKRRDEERARRAEQLERAARAETAAVDAQVEAQVEDGGVPTAAWISFAAGGVGAVALVTFGALALSEDSALEGSACGKTQTCSSDRVSSLETYALLADVGLGVGILGAGLGVMFLLLEANQEHDQPPGAAAAVRFAPTLAPNAAGLTAYGRF